MTAPKVWTPKLSPFQRDILPYIAAGWTNKQIAAARRIKAVTVRTQLARVYDTLALNNRTQLAAWALASGLVDMDQVLALLLAHAPHLEAQP